MSMAAERIHTYTPRGACAQIWPCREPEVLIAGPAGTGKTRSALEKLHMVMLMNPGARGLICRKTQSSLGSTSLETWRKAVVPEIMATGDVRFHGGSAEKAPAYRYRNGSTVVIGGMDKATKIMSSEYDLIYVGEATELTTGDWEALTTRLRNGVVSFQQLLADCNPDTDTHWLNQRCNAGATRRFISVHEDNPTLFDALPDGTYRMTPRGEAYMGKLDALTGVRYLRLRKGIWAAAEGVIYDGFDPNVHLVDSFPVPEDWQRWWSVDFGYRHPFVLQCWAEDGDGRLFLYRELYHTGKTVDEHAKDVLRIVAPRGEWTEPSPMAIVTDHDAEGRATLEKALGRSTVPAHKKVTEGIQAVQRRLRDRRLFIMRGCRVRRDPELADAGKPTCTEEEIPGYVWADTPSGQPKEQPVKDNDDGCDAMRYMVAKRDLGGRPNVRFM